jgi:hypothetical protein
MTDSPVDRAFPRLQLGISAQLETLDGRQRVRLMDLSQGGAHLILSHTGSFRECVLTWLGFEVFGAAAWSEGKHFGLTFENPLPLRVLVETRQRAPSVVREEEENAAKEWVAGTLQTGSDR